MKLAGIVVTYNRKEDLAKNILAVKNQSKRPDAYYIIDNASTDGTFDYLDQKGLIDPEWIRYVCLQENGGGAGGFFEGVKRAYEDGYDLILMMDDDGRPACSDTVEKIYDYAVYAHDQLDPKLMLNSLVVCDQQRSRLSFGLGTITTREEAEKASQDSGGTDIVAGLINPFNGTLLSRELVEEIGYPNADFFIRGDDVDYQSRAQRAGALLATVTGSVYYHPTFELFPVRWMGRTVRVGICSPWKSYYQIRNYVYRKKRDSGIKEALKDFIFQMYCARKCNPEYKACRPFMIKGLRDGLKGRLGKVVVPGQKTVKG